MLAARVLFACPTLYVSCVLWYNGCTMSIFIVMAVVRAMCSDDPDERLWGWVMFAISWVVVIVGVIVLCVLGVD